MPIPVRLDFFGDALESIRTFDPETQRTVGTLRALDLVPMSEVQLTTDSIKRFRQSYVAPSAPRPATTGSTRPSAKAAAIRGSSIGCRSSTTGSTRFSTMFPDIPLVFDRTGRRRGG